MKATATCPKCDSKRIMKVTTVADATDYNGLGTDVSERQASTPVRRQILVKVTKSYGILGRSESQDPTGEVEAYVCADCGYFEEYLAAPAEIEWDHILGARPYSVPGSGPYR